MTISTSTKKNIPIYNLDISIQPGPGSASSKTQTITLARSFTEWFDAVGHFVAPPFQTMLASSVPAIGKFDAKRAGGSAQASTNGVDYSAEDLDAMLAATNEDSAKATGSSAKKGGKRRKV